MYAYFTRIQPIGCLTSSEKQQIVALYLQYYDATDENKEIHFIHGIVYRISIRVANRS